MLDLSGSMTVNGSFTYSGDALPYAGGLTVLRQPVRLANRPVRAGATPRPARTDHDPKGAPMPTMQDEPGVSGSFPLGIVPGPSAVRDQLARRVAGWQT